MSFSRALAPFRRGHFGRGRNTNPFSIFERDPFFAGIAPLLSQELSPFQRFNFPRLEFKEGAKAYRLEAEVPGFRKTDLSIDFPDPRTLRLTGKRHVRSPDTGTAGSETLSESANTVESNAPEASEASETVESSTSDASVAESGSKAVEKTSETGEDFQVVESEFDQEVSFTRQLTLPEGVDINAVKASLDHGILSVVLPKLRGQEAQRIVIE